MSKLSQIESVDEIDLIDFMTPLLRNSLVYRLTLKGEEIYVCHNVTRHLLFH